ncbi:MAG: hypothetical protein NTV87_15525 [Ignavibacteriae bacterium]|jgi:hypothetical protein|nr:hypothetical protein [Ignavibacteriota bacterium]
MKTLIITSVLFVFLCQISYSQSADEIAKKLANPVASMISVPFQNNFDFNIKPNSGFRWTMNFQPVIPFTLNKNWNLISRTILPVVSQFNVIGNSTQIGIHDVSLSLFLSPSAPGIIWGIGPVFNIPIAAPVEYATKKWGFGPTFAGLVQEGKLTFGALFSHMWSFAGKKSYPNFSLSYLQPFCTQNFTGGWGISLSSEMSSEWKSKTTTGAVILVGSKVTKIGGQIISFALGPKYYFANSYKPEFGFRASVTFVFAKSK